MINPCSGELSSATSGTRDGVGDRLILQLKSATFAGSGEWADSLHYKGINSKLHYNAPKCALSIPLLLDYGATCETCGFSTHCDTLYVCTICFSPYTLQWGWYFWDRLLFCPLHALSHRTRELPSISREDLRGGSSLFVQSDLSILRTLQPSMGDALDFGGKVGNDSVSLGVEREILSLLCLHSWASNDQPVSFPPLSFAPCFCLHWTFLRSIQWHCSNFWCNTEVANWQPRCVLFGL